MLVVADTSALLALVGCQGLPLLDGVFGEVRVPRAVFDECTVFGRPGADVLEEYLRAKVTDVDLSELVIAAGGLGRGELEAMALYKRLGADRLLIDDRRARRVAQINRVEVIGSIGVLLLAKRAGLVPAVRPLLGAIEAAGIYLSERVLTEALRLADES